MNVLTVAGPCYKNGVPTVEALRKSGFKVRVYHGRVFHPYRDEQLSLVCSKYDYVNKSGFIYIQEDINCHGGFTRVEVTTLDGKTLVGKYNFGNRPFNRKIGLQAAIGKALKGYNE